MSLRPYRYLFIFVMLITMLLYPHVKRQEVHIYHMYLPMLYRKCLITDAWTGLCADTWRKQVVFNPH